MNEIIGKIIISIGIIADFIGCIGLIRFPDVYTRLQASTKCVTLGTCGIFFGVFVHSGFTSLGIKALLIVIFVFLTSPVSSHALARAAYRSGVKMCDKSVCDEYKSQVDRG
ncbi:MAG: monovalent cation/H(+) antiporter subunit G [Endomicrobia bacterium]|nr:monovalent cation/H(+) antiporter subunit G [Endomicrobiia bacterium]MCX7940534.1 monovalent cation/H(+) antiporter subunit G [Endomicrobiia bacterium]MDW8056019.1 monovalent cation/H(+) antiporter subunit G [Elusimicrobiota bacterium]